MFKLIGIAVCVGIGFAALKTAEVGGASMEASVHDDVTSGSVKEYNMAKRHGDKTDVCVRAGLVAEAYLQAKDEANYARWRETQRIDCQRAGLSGF